MGESVTTSDHRLQTRPSGADESELGAHEKRVEEHEQNYGQQPTEHE